LESHDAHAAIADGFESIRSILACGRDGFADGLELDPAAGPGA
jgi:hypothetical protein